MEVPNGIHHSWHKYLKPIFASEAMSYIKNVLLPFKPFCPQAPLIFRVLSMPIDKIRVVVIGQDPYPNPNHAVGLAFAVPKNTKPPYSLDKIISEIAITTVHDLILEGGEGGEFDETLQHWVDQGVFLLNRSLTCYVNEPDSHKEYWKGFTNYLVDIIAKERKNIIWMLWGNEAKSLTNIINKYEGHTILEAYHPASEKYGYNFIGCNHFKITNELLVENNEKPINWVSHNYV